MMDNLASVNTIPLDEIDVGKYVGAVFVDLSKAFDMVNHELPIEKLHTLGIKENENLWLKSYLTNRTQCVSINYYNS